MVAPQVSIFLTLQTNSTNEFENLVPVILKEKKKVKFEIRSPLPSSIPPIFPPSNKKNFKEYSLDKIFHEWIYKNFMNDFEEEKT